MKLTNKLGFKQDRHYVYLLLGFGILVFWRTLGYEFVWDDVLYITGNSLLNNITLRSFLDFWTHPGEIIAPVTYFVWALIKVISGGSFNPAYFHAANLIIHFTNTVVVFLLLRKLKFDQINSFFGALIFLIHPIQIESTSWTAELRGLLSAFGGFTAILLLLNLDAPFKFSVINIKNYCFCLLLFIISIFSKPVGIVFPFIYLVIAHFYFNKPFKAIILPVIPWFLMAFIQVILTYNHYYSDIGNIFTAYPPFYLRIVIWLNAISLYLSKIVFPLKNHVLYGQNPEVLLNSVWTYIAPVITILSIASTQLIEKHRKELNLFWIVFIIGFLPVSGLIPFDFQKISMIADRYLYISMFAISLLIAYILNHLKSKIVIFSVVTFILMFIVKSVFFQIPTWKSNETLWSNVIFSNPKEKIAYYNRGLYYQKNDIHYVAIQDFQTALLIDSLYYDANLGLARSYWKLGLIPAAQKELYRIEKESVNISGLNYEKANLLYLNSKYHESIDLYKKAIIDNPNNAKYYYNLGNAFYKTGNYKEAATHYSKAIDLIPGFLQAHNNRFLTYSKLDNKKAAEKDLSILILNGILVKDEIESII